MFVTWDAALSILAGQAQFERLVAVLDKFPYIITADTSLAPVLQQTGTDH